MDSITLNCGCIAYKDGSKDLCLLHLQECLEEQRRAHSKSWEGHVDRMSGASDDYEKDPNYHEMGH